MRIERNGAIAALHGHCRVEDAETLAALLWEGSVTTLDLSGCDSLHGAVVQAILAFQPSVVGSPGDEFLKQHLVPALARRATAD
ncbi:hypothetical protein [Caulobacter hibisci]|uniref:STAS domain-containing protein n=1 Tax=Caulobacter hibisci TaxID=2035993 RepID=A0ABS0T0C8_9CAUL|nr:hypothetical protein [Caulobacter hibisci]MBI1684976.1 hypothetical protein [Caulobacter hibisci]